MLSFGDRVRAGCVRVSRVLWGVPKFSELGDSG